MELNKGDILRYRRSEMNFIGKNGAFSWLIIYESYDMSHISDSWFHDWSLLNGEFRNQHLASCCQTPMARSVSNYYVIIYDVIMTSLHNMAHLLYKKCFVM